MSIVPAEKKIPAGILAILLGSLGIHKFFLGQTRAGVITLLVTLVGSLLTFGIAGSIMGLIGVIEGVIYLTKTDSDFYSTYIVGRKEWF